MKKVLIYSSDYCPYCNRAKSLLKRENIAFDEINVSQNDKRKEEMIKKSGGRRTVPQIFIGEIHVGGCDDLYKLHSQNQLKVLLEG